MPGIAMRGLALLLWVGVTPAWSQVVVLPARGERPPNRDPTLMRLTEATAEALQAAIGAPVTIAKSELADQACPVGGECPRDLALLVSADRAITLNLASDQKTLEVKVYGKKRGIETSITLPCKWSGGLSVCDPAGLAQLAAPVGAEPSATPTKDAPKPIRPPQPDVVEAVDIALAKIDRRTDKCRAKGWGELPVGERPSAMKILFRVDAEGSVRDVRLDPAGFSDVPAFSCMARAVESLRFAPGVVDDSLRQRALPLP